MSHQRPWVTRWSVTGRQRSRSFRTKGEAERYRSGLLIAAQAGEAFEDATGEPLSWQPLPDQLPDHEWARRWLAEQWAEWAPRTRVSAVEALSRLVPLLTAATAPRGRSTRKAVKVRRAVSIRSLPSPATTARVLDAMPSHQPASSERRGVRCRRRERQRVGDLPRHHRRGVISRRQDTNVVIDTDALSWALDPRPTARSEAARSLIAGRTKVVSFVAVTELRYGALRAGGGDWRMRRLDRSLGDLDVIQTDERLISRCAELRSWRAELGTHWRRRSTKPDRWVAATALALDLDLIAGDTVYKHVAGLSLLTVV